MRITVNEEPREVEEGFTVFRAIERYSPYGDDALICRLNGEVIKSIDESADIELREGDTLVMYPLVIGG